jgi:hypothetical protein
MPATATGPDRRATNRANSQYSTGPRTDAGKRRSSLNALRHGLTAASAVLPSEDHAAFDAHRRRFFDEYQPATPTKRKGGGAHRQISQELARAALRFARVPQKSLLVQEIADTAWRLNRIPLLEAEVLARAANPPNDQARIDFDIVDAHRLIANLGIQGQRRDLKDAAALLELHKHKGIPWEPADHGFVFSKDHVERFAQRLKHLNEARHIEYVLFHGRPGLPGRDRGESVPV